MSQIDPTDHALAAIASILEQPETAREPEAASPQTPPPIPAPPPLPLPEAVAEETPLAPEPEIEPGLAPIEAVEAAGYSKIGPGPMAAIRFKWTVRRDDDGHFYVNETIGENSTPIVIGPLSAEAAIRTVDDRESEARLRFEQLRNEMTGRAAAANLVRNDGGEM
ncbi:MAG TPA: hypothetical protein VE221_01835 [Sphingomicrobium sp.]|nr:hypothetical protein [Sphingomicrobium sp.]